MFLYSSRVVGLSMGAIIFLLATLAIFAVFSVLKTYLHLWDSQPADVSYKNNKENQSNDSRS